MADTIYTLPSSVSCNKQFAYNCDNYWGAVVEQQLRDYDRQRWAHLAVQARPYCKRRRAIEDDGE